MTQSGCKWPQVEGQSQPRREGMCRAGAQHPGLRVRQPGFLHPPLPRADGFGPVSSPLGPSVSSSDKTDIIKVPIFSIK